MNEVKNCGRSGGRKIRVGDRGLFLETQAWMLVEESDRKMGLWGPVFFKNGVLVSIFHWRMKVIFCNWHLSESSLGQNVVFLVVELARSSRVAMPSTRVVQKDTGWNGRCFPSLIFIP